MQVILSGFLPHTLETTEADADAAGHTASKADPARIIEVNAAQRRLLVSSSRLLF